MIPLKEDRFFHLHLQNQALYLPAHLLPPSGAPFGQAGGARRCSNRSWTVARGVGASLGRPTPTDDPELWGLG